ncbi:hypothetical protein ABH892_002422 [Paenibacillus sp. RC254]
MKKHFFEFSQDWDLDEENTKFLSVFTYFKC